MQINKRMTRLEATQEWVRGFNEIPTSMIAKLMQVEPDDWHEVTRHVVDNEVKYNDELPMWGTMWSFGDRCDELWLDEKDGITAMSQCGFRIFKSFEFGYFFGIDGVGYDFYEAHWLPLYEARGLMWHDIKTDEEANVHENCN